MLVADKSDVVLFYGDANTTLAEALAASNRLIAVALVEAGLRSFNCKIPKEINRALTEYIANSLSLLRKVV